MGMDHFGVTVYSGERRRDGVSHIFGYRLA